MTVGLELIVECGMRRSVGQAGQYLIVIGFGYQVHRGSRSDADDVTYEVDDGDPVARSKNEEVAVMRDVPERSLLNWL